eukprot:TRINITY_DN18540_c0_g1_i3.p1 TRINITY_DN18540_c0_g1~~TRINITY_DN18540_c0_g1_i3.p1  ORF type:complete len:354 (-),score=54.98 TRINITY_DN18540_c0_g1_i3:26-1087(-)
MSTASWSSTVSGFEGCNELAVLKTLASRVGRAFRFAKRDLLALQSTRFDSVLEKQASLLVDMGQCIRGLTGKFGDLMKGDKAMLELFETLALLAHSRTGESVSGSMVKEAHDLGGYASVSFYPEKALETPSKACRFDIFDESDIVDKEIQTAQSVASVGSLTDSAGIQADKVTSEKCVGSDLVLFQLASCSKSDADTQTSECEISTAKKPSLVCSRSVQTASLPKNRKCRTNGRAVQTACGPALCEFSCQTGLSISLSQSPGSSNVGSTMSKLPGKVEMLSVPIEYPSQDFLVQLLREFSRAWPWAFKQLDCDGVIRQFKRYIVEISSHDVAYSDLRGDALNARITALLHDRQ